MSAAALAPETPEYAAWRERQRLAYHQVLASLIRAGRATPAELAARLALPEDPVCIALLTGLACFQVGSAFDYARGAVVFYALLSLDRPNPTPEDPR